MRDKEAIEDEHKKSCENLRKARESGRPFHRTGKTIGNAKGACFDLVRGNPVYMRSHIQTILENDLSSFRKTNEAFKFKEEA